MVFAFDTSSIDHVMLLCFVRRLDSVACQEPKHNSKQVNKMVNKMGFILRLNYDIIYLRCMMHAKEHDS